MQVRPQARAVLTLDQREVVLLHEALERILLKLQDIRSQTKRGQDGREDNAVTHVSFSDKTEVYRKEKRGRVDTLQWCGESEAELRRVFMFGSSWRERHSVYFAGLSTADLPRLAAMGGGSLLSPKTLSALVRDGHAELLRLLPTALWRLANLRGRCYRCYRCYRCCRCRRLEFCAMLHRTHLLEAMRTSSAIASGG